MYLMILFFTAATGTFETLEEETTIFPKCFETPLAFLDMPTFVGSAIIPPEHYADLDRTSIYETLLNPWTYGETAT